MMKTQENAPKLSKQNLPAQYKSGALSGGFNAQQFVNHHIAAAQTAELDSNMANNVTLPNE